MRPLHSMIVLYCLVIADAEAQVSLQQPIISQFGTATTVNVPDRGRALLGSTSLSREARSMTRFPVSRSGYGRETSASGLSTSAIIQDFAETDRQLLRQQPADSRLPFEETSRETAWRFSRSATAVAPYSSYRDRYSNHAEYRMMKANRMENRLNDFRAARSPLSGLN